MREDWLAKYPKAAAMLQQAESGEAADAELSYTPDIGTATPPSFVDALIAGMATQSALVHLPRRAERRYDPSFAAPPAHPLGVTTVPAAYGWTYRHPIMCAMPVDLVMRDGATTSLLPTCATAYPAPVCRCGAWRLAWEEHPVQMLREPGDQPGPVRWWPAMRVVSYYDLGVGAWLFRADCLHGDQQHQVTGTSAQQVRDRLTEFMHRLAP